jgi:hypothetical protein
MFMESNIKMWTRLKRSPPWAHDVVAGSIVLLASAICGFGQADQEQARLVTLIAGRYRANQSILTSFYYEYQKDFSIPQGHEPPGGRLRAAEGDFHQIMMKGKYASSEDRLYEREDSSEPDQYVQFVRNGDLEHSITPNGAEGRIVVRGNRNRAPVKPLSSGPWGLEGLSLSAQLDRLDPRFDRIASVEVKEIDGRSIVVVKLNQRLATDPEGRYDNTLEMHFSAQEGFAPVRMLSTFGKSTLVIDTKVTKILTYDVGGTTLYLPGQLTETRHQAKELVEAFNYTVSEKSVRINPRLPDDLFAVSIRPGDILVDKEAGGLQLSTDLASIDPVLTKSIDEVLNSLESAQPSATADVYGAPEKSVETRIARPPEASVTPPQKKPIAVITLSRAGWCVLVCFIGGLLVFMTRRKRRRSARGV